ncbi:MAG: tRNA (adenosine(37)-N6)-threonylcarbamoyltransferase complex dimerization subunit type 1 TsaB [Eubacteriales bacterium]|nr:tRNA (adenosine(37)-N6)-threonylcarbamoyltransferase complex dimerization subunit type 1 TsaB [Eubacteriales bacterium]
MKLLAIESSAVTASVAIMTEDILTAEYTINYKKTHSQTLLPMIDEICKMTETDVNTIDYYAVSVGPGSFTGLRIGAATGKGMALATGKDMVAVPTLEALAYNLYGTDKLVCSIMDAKRRHLYCGMYTFDEAGNLKRVKNQCLISYEELADMLNEMAVPVFFVGDGIAAAGDMLKESLKVKAFFAPAHMNTQRAASVAMAAISRINQGDVVSADALRPDYLRPSQAERELSEKMKNNE